MSKSKFQLIGLTNRNVEHSFNFMALKTVASLLPKDFDLKIVDIRDIPFYDPDLERVAIPESVHSLQQDLMLSSGLIIFTPEYNHSLPPKIKNCLDWLSRLKPNPLVDLPTMIGSVTTGHLGGARVQYELRRVLDSQQANTLIKPEVFIGNASLKFNSAGECIDEVTIKVLSQQIESFMRLLENTQLIKSKSGL